MNNDKPVDLVQKVDFLLQKIDYLHSQVKQSSLFELKMKFIDYIDTSIERICILEGKKAISSGLIRKKYEEYYNAEQNQRQKTRIQEQKEALSMRLQKIKEKQKQIEIESLRIELENNNILKHNILKEANAKELELKQYVHEIQKKVKTQQKQIQRLMKLNSAQGRQIQNVKQERNRAEKKFLQWKERYESQIGLLQTFSDKKSKYIYRHQDGLKIVRTITNNTSNKKGCQRLFVCDLPLKFHVIKIAYGIKIGMMQQNREIQYFQEVCMYEKEEMQVSTNDGQLTLIYVKRRVTVKLDKYKLPKNQIVVMLFGRGDSIGLDESSS